MEIYIYMVITYMWAEDIMGVMDLDSLYGVRKAFSACYILSNEFSIPFYSTITGITNKDYVLMVSKVAVCRNY